MAFMRPPVRPRSAPPDFAKATSGAASLSMVVKLVLIERAKSVPVYAFSYDGQAADLYAIAFSDGVSV